MDCLKIILNELKSVGAVGIKISFEDEGALLNEMISMRYLSTACGLEMSVKIGGSESKRDIVDCKDLCADSIVAPMIESQFALKKFVGSIKQYNYKGNIGFNLETITAYNNIDHLSSQFNNIDFVTFGRVDFVNSINKPRDYVDSDDIQNYIKTVFTLVKKYNKMCYLGGAISSNTAPFLTSLLSLKLIDKFETRYVIFNASDVPNIEEAVLLANKFEVEWMKYIQTKYNALSIKDQERIKMIEHRIINNAKNTI